MSAEVIAILSVGVALAAVMVSGQRALRAEIRAVRTDLAAEIQSVRVELREGLAAAAAERAAIRTDLRALAERVARLEGAVPFLAPRPLPEPEKPAV